MERRMWANGRHGARTVGAAWLTACSVGAAGCTAGPSEDRSAAVGVAAHSRYVVLDGALPRPGALGGPVWLIGIDGATWNVIMPMIHDGELPNFTALMSEGAHGVLRSEEPTISPALWATIATGVPRSHHGVVNFVERRPGTYETVEVGPPDRRAPALWELVGAAGGSSAVISWFGSYPAEEIRGYYVSKRFDPENPEAGQVYPDSFAERLHEDAIVRMRKGDLAGIGWSQDYRNALLDDARTAAVLRVVVAESRPDFVAVYFSGIDVVQHLTWGDMDPASRVFPEDGPSDADLGGIIPAYYRYIDHTLGEIRELAPEGATLIVVSDHGGGPMTHADAFLLELPVLLEELRLAREQSGPAIAISEMFRDERRIWLDLEGIEPDGTIPVEDAAPTARTIHDRLSGMRTDGGAPVFDSVIDHLAAGDWQPGEPALTVRFSDAARSASSLQDGEHSVGLGRIRFRLPGVSGCHRPDGIVLLSGPGVRPGRLEGAANLYQIAPTLLYLLGLPQDERMVGAAPLDAGVMTDALRRELLERHAIVMVREYPGTDRSRLLRANLEHVELDPEHGKAMESLRTLGYVQ